MKPLFAALILGICGCVSQRPKKYFYPADTKICPIHGITLDRGEIHLLQIEGGCIGEDVMLCRKCEKEFFK